MFSCILEILVPLYFHYNCYLLFYFMQNSGIGVERQRLARQCMLNDLWRSRHRVGKNFVKQDSILVGCVPPACQPYGGGGWPATHAHSHACPPTTPPVNKLTDRYKTLPCPKLHLWVVTRKYSSRMYTTHLPTVGTSVATSCQY